MAAALTIVVSAAPGERRTALLRDDALLEAWVERPGRPDGVGDLHRGRITALAPAKVSPETTARIVANATAEINPSITLPPTACERCTAAMLLPPSSPPLASR